MPWAAQLDLHGEPEKVLHMREVPKPTPESGQALVKMLYAPVNPSELLLIRGDYGKQNSYPVTPGFEGVGIVEEVRNGIAKTVMGIRPGRKVVVLNPGPGNWQEYATVPALRCFPVPAGIKDEQAACYFVNPGTAWAMIKEVLKVQPGNWLIQSAAGSAVGRMVIRLGLRFGFQTINVVRSSKTAEELKKLGAMHVIVHQGNCVAEAVQLLTSGKGADFALDCVGGEMGSVVLANLGMRGRGLIYGTLDTAATTIQPRKLIMSQQSIEGFSLNHFSQSQSKLKMLSLLKRLGPLIADGTLASEIGEVFPLAKIQDAIKASETPGRTGKVLIRMHD